MSLYPLRFQPIFRQYLWGGRRLGSLLNKSIGSDDDYAESWELVDRANDQSVVTHGALQGKSLSELILEFGKDLVGSNCFEQINSTELPEQLRQRFPLLLKYLDAHRVLSVQVHPDDSYGMKMGEPDLGKTEAWFVVHAEPESKIYAGLKKGVTQSDLRIALEKGKVEECLHVICPNAGDCVFIPAGTVHAIGSGLVIAEIQQSSDTTFRLFDWNRVDKSGKARPLHIDQSFDVIDFDRGPVEPQVAKPMENGRTENLVDCDKFVLNRWSFEEPVSINTEGRFRILTVTDGTTIVEGDPSGDELAQGQTIFIPAACSTVELKPVGKVSLLEIY